MALIRLAMQAAAAIFQPSASSAVMRFTVTELQSTLSVKEAF